MRNDPNEDLRGVVITDAKGNVIDPAKIELDDDFVQSLLNPVTKPIEEFVEDVDPSVDRAKAAPSSK